VRGEDEQGQPIDVRHPLAEQLRVKAIEGGPDPRPLLGMVQLFGDTGTDPRLVGPVEKWLASLYSKGSRETLAEASRILKF
jgi:mannitol-1-phosphate/altronate dehydrogenase